MIPTRSRIERWTVAIEELLASSVVWRMAASQAETAADGYVAQVSSPGGTEWLGQGADAALDSAFADRLTAFRSAEVMRELSDQASRGADEIESSQRSALGYITTIEADGFTVSEDLSVIDNSTYTDPVMFAQRQALAEEHRGVLAFRAGALADADAEVAMTLNKGAAELTVMVPSEWSKSGIQLVDFRTDKPPTMDEDGTPQIGPFPVPPSVKAHEPPLPPPPPAPPWQQELDTLREQLEAQGRTIEDLQEQAHSPTTAGVGTAIVGGCASAAVPVAIAGAVTGPVDGPLTAGACVVGSAAGLASYLTGIWVTNAVG